jgi:hypothetical protein
MTLNDIQKDPNSVIVRVNMDINKFIQKYKSSSHYFRTLAHSNSSIGRRTNKDFFKRYIDGGAYRSDLTSSGICFTIIVKYKDDTRTPTIDSSLKLRLLKLVYGSRVEINTLSEESNENLIRIFTLRQGSSLFQPFGKVYKS